MYTNKTNLLTAKKFAEEVIQQAVKQKSVLAEGQLNSTKKTNLIKLIVKCIENTLGDNFGLFNQNDVDFLRARIANHFAINYMALQPKLVKPNHISFDMKNNQILKDTKLTKELTDIIQIYRPENIRNTRMIDQSNAQLTLQIKQIRNDNQLAKELEKNQRQLQQEALAGAQVHQGLRKTQLETNQVLVNYQTTATQNYEKLNQQINSPVTPNINFQSPKAQDAEQAYGGYSGTIFTAKQPNSAMGAQEAYNMYNESPPTAPQMYYR